MKKKWKWYSGKKPFSVERNKRTENTGFSNRHIYIAMKKLKFNPLPQPHSYTNCYFMCENILILSSKLFKLLSPAYNMFNENTD